MHVKVASEKAKNNIFTFPQDKVCTIEFNEGHFNREIFHTSFNFSPRTDDGETQSGAN